MNFCVILVLAFIVFFHSLWDLPGYWYEWFLKLKPGYKILDLKPSVLAGFPWHCSNRGRGCMPPHYCQVGAGSLFGPIDIWGGASSLLARNGSSSFLQSFHWYLPGREELGVPCYCSHATFTTDTEGVGMARLPLHSGAKASTSYLSLPDTTW